MNLFVSLHPKVRLMVSPKISVIVPIYMVEEYLRQCLDSLVNQTYKDIEIILVDDGSPDRCGEICEEYAKKDARIIVIHQENGGLSAARNAGLDIAQGEYIMFVDSDDWVEPSFCEKALEAILEHQVDMAIMGFFVTYKNKVVPIKTPSPRILDGTEAMLHVILHDEPSIYNAVWNKIYHKRLFLNLRFPLGMIAEDAAVQYKILHITPKVYVFDQCLYYYRKRMYSLAGSVAKNNLKTQCDIIQVFYERLKFIKENLPDPELIKHQILLITKKVIANRKRLNKAIPEEKRFYDLMTTFLKENKDFLLSLPCDKYTRVYLRSEHLYHIYFELASLKGKVYSWLKPHKNQKSNTPDTPKNEYFY